MGKTVQIGKDLGKLVKLGIDRSGLRQAPQQRPAMRGLSGDRARALLVAPVDTSEAGEESVELPFPYRRCEGCDSTLVTFSISGRNTGQWFLVYNIDTDGSTDVIDHADIPHPKECQVNRGPLVTAG